MARFSSFDPIEERTLADIVTARIRRAIVEGDLAPGERLTEPVLADSFGVSRSPVREALYRLKREGLITGSAAYYVWDPAPADVFEVFSLQRALECLALEWAVDALTEEDLLELKGLVDRGLFERDGDAPVSLVAFFDTERRFYQRICRRSGHRRLLEWWEQLVTLQAVLVSSCAKSRECSGLQGAPQAYHALLVALERRDLSGVRRANRALSDLFFDGIRRALPSEKRR